MESPTSDQHQRSLEALGRRLEERGFVFMPRAYFAPGGIFVAVPPAPRDPATPPPPHDPTTLEYQPHHIQAFGPSVFLYHSAGSWEARVTHHGGYHWVLRTETLDELEEVALEALRTHERPPSSRWVLV